MGILSKSLGASFPFEFEGQTYHVSAWTYGVMEDYETYLEAAALSRAYRLRRHMDPAEWAEYYRDVKGDVCALEFSFGTETLGRSLAVPRNVRQILLYSLQVKHKDVDLDFVERLWASPMRDRVLELMAAANADPNSTGPAGPGAEPGHSSAGASSPTSPASVDSPPTGSAP